MPIWQLCANLLIPNCLRSNLSYSPLAALELYVIVTKPQIIVTNPLYLYEHTTSITPRLCNQTNCIGGIYPFF